MNSVAPDQTPRSAASDLGLHSLFRPVCSNTLDKYGIIVLLVKSIFVWTWKLYQDAAFCGV